MPTVSVGRDRLFAALGRTYTQEEFEDLCFNFGIELDDVTTEKAITLKEKHLEEEKPSLDDEVIYKIEVPANRYDLLCLKPFAFSMDRRRYLDTLLPTLTSPIRPFVVCAVLRGITFDEASYNSFIDLQDKLHQNICRKRTLVAIGTHDLDTLQGPFTYEALPPPEINFVPLKQVKNFRADELMEFYKSDLKLKKFLHIIEKSKVFPVIYDRNRTVLSLPPIINGAHSAITLKTKNVFIECTATDLTKAKIVLNTMVTTFSAYCERKFEVEPVEVISFAGNSTVYPDLSEYNIKFHYHILLVTSLLNRMQLHAEQAGSGDNINVSVPPTRSDILHPCDVMEDVAIAYGYNNIPRRKLSSLKPVPLNQLSDLIRYENFEMLTRKDEKSTAVVIGNPHSSDFEVVRASLMPGMLKTVGHNKDHPKPIKIFEVGDVVLLDEKKDVGASNHRLLAALYCGANSGFESTDNIAQNPLPSLKEFRNEIDVDSQPGGHNYGSYGEVMGTPFVPVGNCTGYYIELSDEPEFLSGRQAKIIYKGRRIGIFRIVHPERIQRFGSFECYIIADNAGDCRNSGEEMFILRFRILIQHLDQACVASYCSRSKKAIQVVTLLPPHLDKVQLPNKFRGNDCSDNQLYIPRGIARFLDENHGSPIS
ncbi:hypothetical protein CRYUN_Cryun19dG0053400 [Craigia yunnanensis]